MNSAFTSLVSDKISVRKMIPFLLMKCGKRLLSVLEVKEYLYLLFERNICVLEATLVVSNSLQSYGL